MPRRKSGRWPTRLKGGVIAIVKLVAIVALPFVTYVRASALLYALAGYAAGRQVSATLVRRKTDEAPR